MMFSRIYGKGQAIIIIHGLFGMSDNWNSIGKKIADNFNIPVSYTHLTLPTKA